MPPFRRQALFLLSTPDFCNKHFHHFLVAKCNPVVCATNKSPGVLLGFLSQPINKGLQVQLLEVFFHGYNNK